MKHGIQAQLYIGDRPLYAFAMATGFERVAAELHEQIIVTYATGKRQTGNITRERVVSEMVPYAMNQSFAFELYVKCLFLIRAKTPPHGHHSLALFRALPTTLQREISRRYRAIMARNDPGKDSGARSHALTYVLRSQNESFVNFRYLYEQNVETLMTTMPILPPIRLTILRLKPEWAQFAAGLET
jgi:hypothetical protein